MSKVVGDIAVQVGADVSGLQVGMDRAGRSVKGFEAKSAKMAATVAKVGLAVTAAIAAVAVGTARLAANAASTAKQIQNLSNIAGVGAVEFQRYSQAANSVGIEQEKLGDIFKDVNDKFGDFMATGAGPLADFFENIAPAVGVTAEQFARLSGPEALQLYVSSLEQAGASQQQMTFYMEALASDATALLPLLKNNGEEMGRLGDQAERSGRVMSQAAVDGGAALDTKLRELSDTLKTNLNSAILENSDDILALAETITEDWIPALVNVAGFIADVVAAISNMVSEIGSAIGAVVDFGSTVSEYLKQPTTGSGGRRNTSGRTTNQDQLPPTDPDAFDPRNGIYGDFSSTYDANVEAEEQARQDALARLEEFRASQKEIEDAADADLISGRSETAERLKQVEEMSQQQRLQAMSGAFGDLASLMQSENDKLFKIGQASAIADAVVNGYSAAVAAWDKGMKVGGPPVAAAFTAASLARTGALISGIASQTSSGSGSSAGGAAVAGGTAEAASPVQRRVAEFQIEGTNVRGLQELADDINEMQRQGYIIEIVGR